MEDGKKKGGIYSRTDASKVNLTEEEWKEVLPKEVFNIAREKGTEWAFTGKYWNSVENGTYYCAACGNPLFVSDAKFESSCGWPSFFSHLPKPVLFIRQTIHMACTGQRYYVVAVNRTSDMFSTMDHRQQDFGIASTLLFWTLKKHRKQNEQYQQDKANDKEYE